MLVMNKRQSTFIKQNINAYRKDTYYRFVQSVRYNWRKLLLLSASALISKVQPLQKGSGRRVLIIDDTVEVKRAKHIESSYKSIYSNKEHRWVNGINVVNLAYADEHSTFQLDFSLRINDSKRVDIAEFTKTLHHKSNGYKRRNKGEYGKNENAHDMVQLSLTRGIQAKYQLVDSWYSKPNFLFQAKEIGIDIVARLANNPSYMEFQRKI